MSICFITTCSKNKRSGGADYGKVPPTIRPDGSLLLARNSIRDRIVKNEIPGDLRGGIKGPDFGGSSAGQYLPAFERYEPGAFMSGLMGALNRQKDLTDLWFSINSLFFISGLYGIVEAREPIQNYDLKLANSQKFWKPALMAQRLMGSLQKTECKLILNCCAALEYSNMVDWDLVQDKFEVLHVVGEKFEFSQIRSAAGELAANANGRLELERIRHGEVRIMTDADIRFVPTRAYHQILNQTPQLPRIKRQKIAVIAIHDQEFDDFNKALGRILSRFFEFIRVSNKDALRSAKTLGCEQCICRISQPKHKGFQIVFENASIEKAIRAANLDPIILKDGYSGLNLRISKE